MKSILNSTGHSLKIPNIVDGEGIYLYDDKGKRYMDLESGVWCTSLGHKHPRITAAVTGQIERVMHGGFCYSHGILQEAAEAVLSLTDLGAGKCVFLCSGSEAIEISRQIAGHLTGKGLSMTLHDSYLGSYSSVTRRDKGWYLFDWKRCEGCDKKESCDSQCPLLQAVPEDIADFVFEPGSSSGFVRFPPKGVIRNLADIVARNGGKVIVNEVTTGIGRTGEWFGHNHYDLKPDMIAMGKGIGNGYPVSVAAIDEKTCAELEEHPFKYAQSHQNDPLGAAVAKAVVEEIREKRLIETSRENSFQFFRELQTLVDGKNILELRGRGSMFALDLADEELTERVFDELLSAGFIVGKRGSIFRIDPPLITTLEDFGKFISAFKTVLKELN